MITKHTQKRAKQNRAATTTATVVSDCGNGVVCVPRFLAVASDYYAMMKNSLRAALSAAAAIAAVK